MYWKTSDFPLKKQTLDSFKTQQNPSIKFFVSFENLDRKTLKDTYLVEGSFYHMQIIPVYYVHGKLKKI